MTKDSLVNFLSDEDRKKLLNFRSASKLSRKPVIAQSVKAVTVESMPKAAVAVPICEFARDYSFPGSSGRTCVDGTFCPSRVYGSEKNFSCCITRARRLREQRKEQI